MTVSSTRRNLWALGGVLFAAFFIGDDFLRGALANGALPLPGAPVGEVVRYFTESRTAALAVASAQVLSALSLLVFVAPVATLVRRVAGERGRRPWCSVGLSLTAGPPRIGDATWRRRARVWGPGHEDLYPRI